MKDISTDGWIKTAEYKAFNTDHAYLIIPGNHDWKILDAWCAKHFQDGVWERKTHHRYFFKNKDDAALFRLFWS